VLKSPKWRGKGRVFLKDPLGYRLQSRVSPKNKIEIRGKRKEV
jgi:hypothetical protein